MPAFKRKSAPTKDFVAVPARKVARFTRTSVKKAVLSVAEMKTRTVAFLEQGIINAANPLYFDFPQIPQGASIQDRVGNKIVAKGLRLSANLFNNGTSVGGQMLVRLVLLRVDEGRYRTNGDITNFFFEAGTDPTFAGTLQDSLREVNREGVKVMMDKTVPLGLNVVSTGTDCFHFFTKYFPLNQQMIFRDTALSDATNVRYTLAVFARDPLNDGAVTTVECSVATRMDYKDM